MLEQVLQLLRDTAVIQAFQEVWIESIPGESGGHEEGGFILRDHDGVLSIIRWPTGSTNLIQVPAHENCQCNGLEIVASFHTHPNTGENYLQEPSISDIDGVCDDPNLKGPFYLGEFVISADWIYLIRPNGSVLDVMETHEVLNYSSGE